MITMTQPALAERRPRRWRQSTQFAPTMDYYIPQWEERTSYGMRRIDPYTKLFEDRIIFLGTPISDEIANAVMAQLLCLQQMDAERDIEIYINSPGGSFTALTAIYDTMRYIKPDVQHGLPRPGGLGRGGDPGRRHQGQAAGPAEQPDPDPPAGDRGRLRAVLRHRDPGQGDPADPVADGGDAGHRHRQDRPRRSAATSSATSTSRPSRPWSTASSTRS